MYTVEHEFYPGEKVFVVLKQHTVREATVIQVDIKIYEKEEAFIEQLEYLVLLSHENDHAFETTERVDVSDIFNTVDEALEKVKSYFVIPVT